MDILITIVAFGVGFFIGGTVMLRSVKKTISRIADRLDPGNSDTEQTNMQHNFRVQEVPLLHTEQHQGILFLYHNSVFVCQGTTLTDLALNFAKVSGMAKVAMVQHDEQHMWFVDGEVQSNI